MVAKLWENRGGGSEEGGSGEGRISEREGGPGGWGRVVVVQISTRWWSRCHTHHAKQNYCFSVAGS